MNKLKYVIIGNSAAGIGAIEGLRQNDQHGEITIISQECHHTYSRPLISYLLCDKTTVENMKYRDDDFYVKNRVTLLSGMRVTNINAQDHTVTLHDGSYIPYDKLLVATGSSPFIPSFDGLDTVTNPFTFMSLDDAQAIKKAITRTSKVLIVGAGLIGLKCAEGISKWTNSCSVDLSARILSSILDEEGSEIVKKHLEENGVSFALSRSVRCFEQNKAILDNGDVIAFDILVLAVGVRPNTGLLEHIAKVEKGIVINTKMETTCPSIYAAGDCTQSVDISSGQEKIMALLPNAYLQGECAGINMAGGKQKFDKAIPMNAIGFFGLHVITAGNYNGDVYSESDGQTYKKLFYSKNRLNGYILIGDVQKAGIYTSLIREQTPLDSIDFPLLCKKPGLMAFTKNERNLKLGGGVK